ncbi:MAG: tetratricopeptide repeat protein, partial [Planctomycetota bacterium]
ELYKNGEITQALLELEEALEINPSNSSWHFNKGVALDAVNRFEEAIQEYEIALELTPFDAEMLNSLGVDYTRTGHYDLAISVFERAQSWTPHLSRAIATE